MHDAKMSLRMLLIISNILSKYFFFLFWPCLEVNYIFKASYFQFMPLEVTLGY